MTKHSNCPCGSQKSYADCCEIAHKNHAAVTTPAQLMRSRYSAHALQLVDYVIDTYHPSCQAELQRESITQSVASHWIKLDVADVQKGCDENEGFVTFFAYFEDEKQLYCLGERSRFLRENGLWYYIDGEFIEQDPPAMNEPEPIETSAASEAQIPLPHRTNAEKVGRNDPCTCGSGKKFKKCCGAA